MRHICFILIYGFVIVVLISCAGKNQGEVNASLSQYQIDTIFSEYYYQNGRDGFLGIPISPIFSKGQFQFQYTISGLLVFNPYVSGGDKCSLMPLGNEMGLNFFASDPGNSDQDLKTEDIKIFPEFVPLYEKLGGETFSGKPITHPHYSPRKRRYEQYFEKIGFFRLENKPLGSVELIAYGVWGCGDSCLPTPDLIGEVDIPASIDSNFLPLIKLAGVDLTGYALTQAYSGNEGYIQQIFENIILFYYPQDPSRISILALPEKLGMLSETPVLPEEVQGYTFIPVQGSFGFLIPNLFIDYISSHGGFEFTGLPIDEFKLIVPNVYRQCFQNLCLIEDLGVEDDLRIRPASLGFTYSQLPGKVIPTRNFQEEKFTPTDIEGEGSSSGISSDSEISIQIWELHQWVTPQQQQEIEVRIYLNGQSVKNVKPVLTLYLPGGEKIISEMPYTDENGQSSLKLDAIDAANGTLIPYQVCVRFVDGVSYCTRGDFLIWYSP